MSISSARSTKTITSSTALIAAACHVSPSLTTSSNFISLCHKLPWLQLQQQQCYRMLTLVLQASLKWFLCFIFINSVKSYAHIIFSPLCLQLSDFMISCWLMILIKCLHYCCLTWKRPLIRSDPYRMQWHLICKPPKAVNTTLTSCTGHTLEEKIGNISIHLLAFIQGFYCGYTKNEIPSSLHSLLV